MLMPNVDNVALDEGSGVTYNVKAYRKLTVEEIVLMIRTYLSGCRKRQRPKRNQQVTIISTIGARD